MYSYVSVCDDGSLVGGRDAGVGTVSDEKPFTSVTINLPERQFGNVDQKTEGLKNSGVCDHRGRFLVSILPSGSSGGRV